MLRVTMALALFSSLALSRAQEAPMPWTWHEVQGARATALAVLWHHGLDDDAPQECGAARVLGECRLDRARAMVPGTKASGFTVGADATVAFVMVEAGDWPRAVAFVEALLDDRAPIDDDRLALAIARSALAADDAEFLYPGLVLQSRARMALCRGTAAGRPVAGSAVAMAALTQARVRQLLQRPVTVRGGGLGALPPALRQALAASTTAPPRPAAAPMPVAVPAAAGPVSYAEHERVDAPFVAAAFPAPREQLAAFALGVEVARLRALRRLRARRDEALARAPFVSWSWLLGDPVVVFCRRSTDFRQLLPGEKAADAAAEAAAAAAELDGLLADLRETPPTALELAAARRSLQLELALLPQVPVGEAALAADGSALPGRLQVLLLGAHRGIDATGLDGVTADAVHAVLRAVLEPQRAHWAGLLPVPRTGVGWPVR